LVALGFQDFEAGAGDQLGDGATELRAAGRVAAAGEHERRRRDPWQAVGRVVVDQRVQEPLDVLGRLLVRERQHLADDRVDGAVVMGPRGVDVEEEGLEERALARRHLDQPVHESHPRAQVAVRRRPGALQDEAADQSGMAERQPLGDDAAAREARDVGGGDRERPQHGGRVVGHRLDRGHPCRHRRAARAAVVEGGHAVAVREAVELELSGLDGVAEAADQQHVGPGADLLDVDVEVAGRQRRVFIAIVLNGIPLDALVHELGSSRNAIYKTLYDARRKLRGTYSRIRPRSRKPTAA
jgi:hypothetical protein